MKKHFSKLITIGAAAMLMGVALVAEAAQSNLNRGPTALSPGGTVLGSASLWVVVNANGTVTRGDGNAVVNKSTGVGIYQARFFRNIRNCVYTASIGLGGAVSTSAPGHIEVVGEAASVTGVFITTRDEAGVLADRGFHLLVTC